MKCTPPLDGVLAANAFISLALSKKPIRYPIITISQSQHNHTKQTFRGVLQMGARRKYTLAQSIAAPAVATLPSNAYVTG
jgi:hypothetical protein